MGRLESAPTSVSCDNIPLATQYGCTVVTFSESNLHMDQCTPTARHQTVFTFAKLLCLKEIQDVGAQLKFVLRLGELQFLLFSALSPVKGRN